MAIVEVLRPTSVRVTGAGTSVPSGTLAAVTSDNSDATYIDFNEADSGNVWNLRVGSHTPPAGHQRHRIRGRIRCRTDAGTLSERTDLGRGTSNFIDFSTVGVTSAFVEQSSDWFQNAGYGLSTVGALADLNIGGGYPTAPLGGATELRTAECYVDVDCRAEPDYAPEVRDAAGVDQTGGTITDTVQPTLFFGGVDYDGLPELDWSVSVSDGTSVVFSSSGAGIPPSSILVTTELADGSYVATFTVRSTIRVSDPYETVQTAGFDVENVVPPPSPPIMSVEEEFGGYRVDWSDPGGLEWDNDFVVAEVWRDDCTGSQRIATVEDGLSGTYLDLAIPQLDPQSCAETEPCDITYRIRYWGYVSTFVELPTTLPADLILGWPDTVASIPAGWSRVTMLDDVYPRGATTTGAPSTTGGASTHTHTTPGHVHAIAGHFHGLGGNTGSSNTSTTSARFNGASQPQADQPHTHVRPSNTQSRTGQDSGSTAPGMSSASDIPPTRTVIWIESDGARTAYPIGILGWSTESISGWSDDAASNGRFLRGAVAGGNGGGTSGATTHTHTVNAHTHTGFSHDHAIGPTGLSNPSSSIEAGTGSSTPRWLPRHTHPMDVTSSSTGSLSSVSGAATSSGTLEPPNRRLRVLQNTGGGIQTRIIGLYLGDVASLDPLLTLCDATAGTPDMRTWFCRDRGSDSVNSTGGSTSHTHATAGHDHGIPSHVHDTNVLTSTTGSFEAPSFGDLGDSPTTTHTHSSGNTAAATPTTSSSNSGTTSSSSHLPPFREAHFVRLDGTIAGGPLPVPELKVTEFSSVTVPAFTYGDGLDRLATTTQKMAVATDRTHAFSRLTVDSVPIGGGLHTIASTVSGDTMALSIAVEGKQAIDQLENILTAGMVFYSPVGGTASWYASSGWQVTPPTTNVKLLRVSMVRQPWPATPDPMDFL